MLDRPAAFDEPHEPGSSLRQTGRAIVSNPAIARAVAAFGGYTIGEWAIWLAMLVYAFDRGGATAAGLVALVQLAPSAILAPILSGLADRFRRERVLLLGYVYLAATTGVTGAALAADAPLPVVYALAAITTIGITITRPAHGSLLPSLARTPEELTAANVATGTVQNVGILVAPLVAGGLLATAGPWAVFAVTAVVEAMAAALVAGIHVERVVLDLDRETDGAARATRNGETAANDGALVAIETETADPTRWIAGLRELGREPGTRAVVLLLAAGSVIEGALDIVAVVLALELLGLGQGGVGPIGAAVGLGGLIGAGAAAALVGRARLAPPFVLGLLLWSLPLLVVGIVPNVALAIVVFIAAGFGRSVMDVAGRTLLQRVAPGHVLSGVFGALEGLHDAMLAVGSLGVPALIAVAGPRSGLVLAGLWLPLVLAVLWSSVRSADRHAIVHVR
ncbi:MAG TPA: MFS transporter, partial [Candidatus Limnocylindrales bacterium]|nr:MFS transporter [Candidatus Limnocylindrales bacterium]